MYNSLGQALLGSFWNFNLLGVRFLPLAKKWVIQIFFEIGPHLPTAPEAFLNRAFKNILISIEIEPLALDA